jgi:hypothetical protein
MRGMEADWERWHSVERSADDNSRWHPAARVLNREPAETYRMNRRPSFGCVALLR